MLLAQAAILLVCYLLIGVFHTSVQVLMTEAPSRTSFEVDLEWIFDLSFKAKHLLIHVYSVVLCFTIKRWADALSILNVKC